MSEHFESLESGEVISVQHDTQVLSGHRTFRVGELSEAIESHLKKAIENWNEENNGWFSPQGIDCEALRFGSNGWQKGRIRLCLEFCPDDEPNAAAQNLSNSTVPAANHPTTAPTTNTIQPPPPPSFSAPTDDVHHQSSLESPATTPTSIADSPDPVPMAVPVAAAIGTAAVAATVASSVPTNIFEPSIPHHAETTLEPEEHHPDANVPHHNSFDEIAFEFDRDNQDRGIFVPNGRMELDLTDLGLDFSEHDLLNFEANGMSEGADEGMNLQDLGKPENSGMLIDEVWNEMNQGNWPGIN
ncbi:KGK domain-containing protein [Chamaesiphon minutus]|uniref:KGK domain protein n=1 Tax=Chamaesiphon minutus (strain ATCC 27169 / PCC 6605) TaxID=1173020 RepID=K9UJY5_CHAP6|nr:KGK domain-containing protein [Chamaesiphon minutus]AFY95397.1 KGK domain protein [Chamaesiphon minutus PCC 6605]